MKEIEVIKDPQVQKRGNRPDLVDVRPVGVLFHAEGSTGWGRVRNIHDHKGWKSEKDFHHLNNQFAGPGDAA
jgi:hypothetical protein